MKFKECSINGTQFQIIDFDLNNRLPFVLRWLETKHAFHFLYICFFLFQFMLLLTTTAFRLSDLTSSWQLGFKPFRFTLLTYWRTLGSESEMNNLSVTRKNFKSIFMNIFKNPFKAKLKKYCAGKSLIILPSNAPFHTATVLTLVFFCNNPMRSDRPFI